VKLSDLGFDGACRVHDLWTDKPAGSVTGEFSPEIPFHGSGLYRVEPGK
jgi:hypothetical protein